MAFSYDLLPPVIPNFIPPITGNVFKIPITLESSGTEKTLKDFGIKTLQVIITNQNNEINNQYIDYIDGSLVEQDKNNPNNFILKLSTTNTNDSFVIKDDFYYKLQIRFSRVSANTLQKNAVDITAFSQWSTTCLLKKIKEPNLIIKANGEKLNQKLTNIALIPMCESIIGKLDSEKEVLHSYKIIIQQGSDDLQNNFHNFLSTDIQTPNERNSFRYKITKRLLEGKTYRIKIKYWTLSGYESSWKTYYFKTTNGIVDTQLFYFQTQPDEETGEIKVHIFGKPSLHRNFLIQRASSDTNFQEWENMAIVQFDGGRNDGSQTVVELYPEEPDMTDFIQNASHLTCERLTWKDRTIKSGVFYKYGVSILYKQIENIDENNHRNPVNTNIYLTGNFQSNQQAYTCIFEDMFLVGNGGQSLRIRYNPTISNFKYNINENIQRTLGSKYPFITRNGKNNYRTFSIGGLITSFMDIDSRYIVPSYENLPHALKNTSNKVSLIQQVTLKKQDYSLAKSLFLDNFTPGPYDNTIDNTVYLTSSELRTKSIQELYSIIYDTFFVTKDDIIQFVNIDSLSSVQKKQKLITIYNNLKNNKMDINNQAYLGNFVLPEKLFSEEAFSEKKKYNYNNNIDKHDDIIYEREFRQAVYQFLYDKSPKLFRSTPEGNMLIKLTNINFTPNQTLGRMLYSFSAQAFEIDDCTMTNFNKYNIYSYGKWKNLRKEYTHTLKNFTINLSQIKKGNIDIFNYLQKQKSFSNFNLIGLSNLKITITANESFWIDNTNSAKPFYYTKSPQKKSCRGWLLSATSNGIAQKYIIKKATRTLNLNRANLQSLKLLQIPSSQIQNKNNFIFSITISGVMHYYLKNSEIQASVFNNIKSKIAEKRLININPNNFALMTFPSNTIITYLNIQAFGTQLSNLKPFGILLQDQNHHNIIINRHSNNSYEKELKDLSYNTKIYYKGILSKTPISNWIGTITTINNEAYYLYNLTITFLIKYQTYFSKNKQGIFV